MTFELWLTCVAAAVALLMALSHALNKGRAVAVASAAVLSTATPGRGTAG